MELVDLLDHLTEKIGRLRGDINKKQLILSQCKQYIQQRRKIFFFFKKYNKYISKQKDRKQAFDVKYNYYKSHELEKQRVILSIPSSDPTSTSTSEPLPSVLAHHAQLFCCSKLLFALLAGAIMLFRGPRYLWPNGQMKQSVSLSASIKSSAAETRGLGVQIKTSQSLSGAGKTNGLLFRVYVLRCIT